jgi:hypothetical protein
VGVDPGVLGERLARLGHLERVGQQRDLPVVRRAQLLERRHDVEAGTARVERVVVVDLGPVEHESHATVGEVQTRRQFRIALVGAVAEAEEAPDLLSRVVDVEVHRLVEVRGGLQLVHVLVLWFQPNAHAHILTVRAAG